MTKCWEDSPNKRPSFKEIHANISKYIGHIGGYLEMSPNHFTSWGEDKIVNDMSDMDVGTNQGDDEAKRGMIEVTSPNTA